MCSVKILGVMHNRTCNSFPKKMLIESYGKFVLDSFKKKSISDMLLCVNLEVLRTCHMFSLLSLSFGKTDLFYDLTLDGYIFNFYFYGQVGLADKLNTVVLALSGGMKRKLSLGIALIGNSKVWKCSRSQ